MRILKAGNMDMQDEKQLAPFRSIPASVFQ